MSKVRDQGSGIAVAACASLGMLLIPLMLIVAPRTAAVAVIGAPGSRFADLARLVADADGVLLRAGGLDNLIVARSDRSGFVARLYAAGAWLVLDPIVAGGCEPPAVASPASATTPTKSRR